MRKKLLLADDSITIQKVVELTFPSDEFEVVTAGNGRLAVDKALTFLPDVVLCDVIMPQLDGYQVCEALRASAQLSKVPILLLNGAFEPYDADRAKAVGAIGNVSKPFDPPALVARVKEILNERSTAAFERPASEPIAAAAPEEVHTADVLPAAAPHEYTYDESETHPVSTVEVPMDVRELAARSLSLDAPVFAPTDPDVLTTEEPSDFAETLHGPLDADVPAMDDAVSAIEMTETEAPTVEAVEAIEAAEDIEPVAVTGEFETPAPPVLAAAAEAAGATEPMEFDEEPPEVPEAAPTVAAATVPVHEFSGEHEFDPAELDAAAPHAAPFAEPEAMAMPEELPEAPPAVIPMPAPAPLPPPPAAAAPPAPVPVPEPVAELRAPAPVAPPAPTPPPAPVAVAPVEVAPEPVSFAGLGSEAAATPAPGNAAPATPSAEVGVPVDMVQQIAQRVISQVSERVIREIAWDVIPGLAEKLIKAEIERIKARAESESD